MTSTPAVLAVAPAAHGGLSGLAALAELWLLAVGALGLVFGAMVLGATKVRVRRGRPGVVIKAVLALSIAYVPVALFFFAMAVRKPELSWWAPALGGGIVAALIVRYFRRRPPRAGRAPREPRGRPRRR